MKRPSGHGTISCAGKVAFESPGIAKTASDRREGRVTYRCGFCGKWHVGCKQHTIRKGEKIRGHRLTGFAPC